MDAHAISKPLISLFEILQLLVGCGLLGSCIIGIFKIVKFVQKFDNLENSIKGLTSIERTISLENSVKELASVMREGFAKMETRFDKIDSEFKDVRKEIGDVKTHLGILETRVDERTLKIVHVDKSGTGTVGS